MGIASRGLRIVVAVTAVALTLGGCADAAKTRELAQQPLSLDGTWRAGLFVQGYGPHGLGPAATASPSAPASGSSDATATDPAQTVLAGIGLMPSDFASGYTVSLVTNGATLGDPTMDYCGKNYPSDKARASRRQVVLIDPAGQALGVLSESVLYTSPAAVQTALTELRAAIMSCDPTAPVTLGTEKYRIARSLNPAVEVADLVPEASRVLLASTLTSISSARTAKTLVLYQVRGSLLVGLYFQHAGGDDFTTKDLENFHALASAIAGRITALDDSVVGLG